MWRVLRGSDGFFFATPERPVYAERLADQDRPVSAGTIYGQFQIAFAPEAEPRPPGSRPCRSDDQIYAKMETYARLFIDGARVKLGALKIDSIERRRVPFGSLNGERFVVEEQSLGILVTIVRSARVPADAVASVSSFPNRPGLVVREPRCSQLCFMLLVQLPTPPQRSPTPPQRFGLLHLSGPLRTEEVEFTLTGEGDEYPFPDVAYFDRADGSAAAAVLTMMLDGGFVCHE